MSQTPEQMSALWSYMQEDIKADKIAQRMKRSELRQNLEKLRDTILAQQTEYKTIEEQVSVAKDRIEMISDAISRCSEQFVSLQQSVDANPPASVEEAQAMLADLERLRRSISGYEKEMKDLQKASNQYMGKVPRIAHSIAQNKQSFDAAKAEYSKESETLRREEAEQRAAAEKKAAGIPEELFNVYRTVKRTISPPMAMLQGDMCMGCNTSQPNATLRKLESGDIVECETCGRILYLRRG